MDAIGTGSPGALDGGLADKNSRFPGSLSLEAWLEALAKASNKE